MHDRTSITVLRPPEEIERLWSHPSCGPSDLDGSVEFRRAPGDRGTEIHFQVADAACPGTLGKVVSKLGGSDPLAHAKDELRRFKQLLETGVIARSDGTRANTTAADRLHPARRRRLQHGSAPAHRVSEAHGGREDGRCPPDTASPA